MKPSKLTERFQATIPKEIRTALQLEPHDSIVFSITKDGTVILKKFNDARYLKEIECTLQEWNSVEDDEAFAHLQNL